MDKLECLLRTDTSRSAVWIGKDAIAYLRKGDGGPRVWELDLSTGERRQRTFGDERIWSIEGHHQSGSIVFCMDEGGNEHEQIYLLGRDGEARDLTRLPEARHFLGGLTPDGRTLVYACNSRTAETFDLWTCDTETGEKAMVLQNSDHYNWPAAGGLSPDGRYLLYNKLLGQSDNALWMLDLQTGKAVRVPADERVSAEVHPAWKHDCSGFFLVTDRDSEFPYVAYYDLAAGKMEKCFAYDWEVGSIGLSSDDRYLAVSVNEDGYLTLHIYDLADGTEVNAPRPPKGVVSAYGTPSWSPTGHRLLFTVASGQRPENVWLLDLDEDSLRPLTRSDLHGLDAGELCEPRLMRCRSFDLYQGRDVQERKNKDLKNQILVLAPSEGIVPADTWLRCRKKLMANITFQGGRKPKNTWLAGKMKCGHCGRALKSLGNRAGTHYLYCTKRADNMSCEGCGTLRTAEFEQFVYEAMVHKLSEFQTLTAQTETVNPRLTALNVELAQVEDEIEKLLNTLTGASAVLMSYANGKIEELDTRRQGLIKEIAALNAESVSPQKIEYLSSHLGNWDNIDFDDRRQVADIILSQVHATADRVSFEWKI